MIKAIFCAKGGHYPKTASKYTGAQEIVTKNPQERSDSGHTREGRVALPANNTAVTGRTESRKNKKPLCSPAEKNHFQDDDQDGNQEHKNTDAVDAVHVFHPGRIRLVGIFLFNV
jgi:hypothetical protein